MSFRIVIPSELTLGALSLEPICLYCYGGLGKRLTVVIDSWAFYRLRCLFAALLTRRFWHEEDYQ